MTYEKYKQFLRGFPCLTCVFFGHNASESSDPAHVKTGSHAGANLKDDGYMVPLCRKCHHLQHNIGEPAFWAKVPLTAQMADYLGTPALRWCGDGSVVPGGRLLARKLLEVFESHSAAEIQRFKDLWQHNIERYQAQFPAGTF